MIFPHPEPQTPRHRILPVFLPFAGCPQRCVFCAQDAQTGQSVEPVADVLRRVDAILEERARHNRPAVEIAFYGGTFSALPEDDQHACLGLAARWRERGMVVAVRCSTRPDALPPGKAEALAGLGMNLIELGVQTFDDTALAHAGRGCHGDDALTAARRVRDAGLGLGLQLLPGMPGVTPDIFRADMKVVASLRPDCLRLYPCLVLEGTGLARLWREGRYGPWDVDTTLDVLADALLLAWGQGIRVIRVGLAQDEGLRAALLAGPWHPALGQMAKAEALLRHIASQVAYFTARHGHTPHRLHAPARWRGLLYGQHNRLASRYAALGLTEVVWDDTEDYTLA